MSAITNEKYEFSEQVALDDVAEQIETVVLCADTLDPLAAKIVAGLYTIPQEEVDRRFAAMINSATMFGIDIAAHTGKLEKLENDSEDLKAVIELIETTGIALASEKPVVLKKNIDEFAKAIEITKSEELAQAIVEANHNETPSVAALAVAAQEFCDDPESNMRVYRRTTEVAKAMSRPDKGLCQQTHSADDDIPSPINSGELEIQRMFLEHRYNYDPKSYDGNDNVLSEERYSVETIGENIESAYDTKDTVALNEALTKEKKSEHVAHSYKLSALRGIMKFLRSRN